MQTLDIHDPTQYGVQPHLFTGRRSKSKPLPLPRRYLPLAQPFFSNCCLACQICSPRLPLHPRQSSQSSRVLLQGSAGCRSAFGQSAGSSQVPARAASRSRGAGLISLATRPLGTSQVLRAASSLFLFFFSLLSKIGFCAFMDPRKFMAPAAAFAMATVLFVYVVNARQSGLVSKEGENIDSAAAIRDYLSAQLGIRLDEHNQERQQ
ncbi:hypothetical protein CRV24_009580 [Beauveria bassiana]|nr:hypothetical protein CRV24_009580 [Beauveria bassiana]